MSSLSEFAAKNQAGHKCKTCSLAPELLAQVNEARAQHIGPMMISRWLEAEHEVHIAPSAIHNHLNRHVRAIS